MSLELIDLRLKITPETACVLEAERQATGRDLSMSARAVLHEWAVAKINKASLLQQLMHGKGIAREHEGMRGRRAADFPSYAESGFHNGAGSEG